MALHQRDILCDIDLFGHFQVDDSGGCCSRGGVESIEKSLVALSNRITYLTNHRPTYDTHDHVGKPATDSYFWTQSLFPGWMCQVD